MKIYENIWKWRKLLRSWASLPIPYTRLLLPSLKTAVFFSQACRPHLRSLGRAWKNADKMISLTDLVFLGDGLKSKRSLKSFIFGFSWNFPRVMKLKEDFCRNFSLLFFKTMGGPNVPIRATAQVIHHVDPKDLPMEGHGIKKKRDNSPRETQRQEPQGTPEVAGENPYPFRVSSIFAFFFGRFQVSIYTISSEP